MSPVLGTSLAGSLSIRRSRILAFIAIVWLLGGGISPAAAADLRSARALLRSGDYEACRQMAAAEVERGVWNVRWPMLLIECQLLLGDYPAAKETYEAAAKRFTFGSIGLQIQGIEVYRYNNERERAAEEQARLEERIRQASGRFLGNENLVAIGRYFVDRGEDARKILELFYDRVIEADADFLDAYIASAELALAKNDFQLAAETVERAKRVADVEEPELFYLESLAWEASDPARSEVALGKALEINPRHLPSLLQRADRAVDAEQYDAAEDWLQKVLKVNLHHPLAWAYHAVLAHLRGEEGTEMLMRAAALSVFANNPEVDYLIGKKLSQKYRFAEGAAAQRRALTFAPASTKIRFQLAQDLLRLGNEEEGWELVRWTQRDDPYNVVAYNLLELFDRVSEFTLLERDRLIVKMDPQEAKIYGERVLDLLTEARASLCEKYAVQPEKPVIVEIFPRQSDFAIRTFGLPGGAGFLGVCFGRVITANSPASQMDSPTNWESVLWHEFCHVVTLEKTRNRMPRWLSEGISVYEERQRDPRWGQQMTPLFAEMIRGPELTPVSELSGAFLNPSSPIDLQFAYYESSLVVEFLIEQHGLEVLKRILDDLAIGMPINEALQRYTGSIEGLNEAFTQYARQRAEALGNEVDWNRELLPPQASRAELAKLREAHPHNYFVVRASAEAALAAGETSAAMAAIEQLDQLYPEDASAGCATEMAAQLFRSQGKEDQEYAALQRLAARRCDDMSTYVRLQELAQARGDWETVQHTAQAILAVNPLLRVGHRGLASAGAELDQPGHVSAAMAALLELDPVDPAGMHFRWGKALHQQGRLAEARRKVLLALEEAPRYREAYRLLLAIEASTAKGREEETAGERPEPSERPEPAESEQRAPAASEATAPSATDPPAESPPDLPPEAPEAPDAPEANEANEAAPRLQETSR